MPELTLAFQGSALRATASRDELGERGRKSDADGGGEGLRADGVTGGLRRTRYSGTHVDGPGADEAGVDSNDDIVDGTDGCSAG